MVDGNGETQGVETVDRTRRLPDLKEERRTLTITPMRLETMMVRVKGLTSVIVHKWSEKALKEMRDKQTRDPSKPKAKRERKEPFDDFKGSLHLLPGAKVPRKKIGIWQSWGFLKDTFGLPAAGFKKGMVYAAQRYGMKAKDVEAAVRVFGDLIPLKYSKVVFREDTVRVGPWNNRVADLRYRGEFQDWSCEFVVEYDADIIAPETIINLINRAGRIAGICEWRPNAQDNPGTFGCYEVDVKGSRK